MLALPLDPNLVLGLVRELRKERALEGPLVVEGARGLAEVLRKQLARGAAAGAVREGGVEGAAALVYVLAGEPTEEDARVLRTSRRRRVPTVCVISAPSLELRAPYVLATDVVRVPAGSGFPVAEIARVLARKLGEHGPAVAARVPALRAAVAEAIVGRYSLRNGFVGAAGDDAPRLTVVAGALTVGPKDVLGTGADLPRLTLNQVRLLLRLGAAHGLDVDAQRLPEIAAVVGGGLAFRGLARRALLAVPGAGWAVRGAVAYAGTRAVGEAAIRYFRARANGSGTTVGA